MRETAVPDAAPLPASLRRRERQSWADALLLLRAFVSAPKRIAAIAPSSPELAAAMASRVTVRESTHVLEIGVGTGALTDGLISNGLAPVQYTGVEVESSLVAALRAKYPTLVFVRESAENLQAIVRDRRIVPSHVVASLPWTCISAPIRRALLARIAEALAPDGWLITYSYLPSALLLGAAGRVERDFREMFTSVHRSSVVWRNLPPATVWSLRP